MKLYSKQNIIKAFLLLTSVSLAGCSSSRTWHDTVVPSTISDTAPSSSSNGDVARRVGISRLALPGDSTYVPTATRSGYIQAFLDMGLDARETPQGFVVFLPQSGYFDKNKVFVKTDLTSKIPLIVAEANKSYLANHKIEVAGHADTPGTLPHNQKLSEKRAIEVMDDMLASGLSRNRISTLGFGERLPLHNQNIHFNRRADIIFSHPKNLVQYQNNN